MTKYIIYFLLLSNNCFAQSKADTTCYRERFSDNATDLDKVFTKLEIEVSFKGGYYAWRSFIKNNISFVNILATLHDSVRYYIDSSSVSFITSKDGHISNINILYAGTSAIKNETIKLIKSSSCYWRPGTNGNRQLNAYHTETIYFIVDKSQDRLFSGFRIKGFKSIVHVSNISLND
jgi:hypothetical protein